jgi:hypothetical protein
MTRSWRLELSDLKLKELEHEKPDLKDSKLNESEL